MNLYSKIRESYTNQEINSGRQLELDIAKALAVLFMVLVHVQMSFSSVNLADSNFGFVVDFLGGIPAAPVFMFLMGVGFKYSKKNDPKIYLKRGIIIFGLGYLLNFLRDSLPAIIDFMHFENEESLISALDNFFVVDILPFAGLAIISQAFLIKYKIKLRGLVILIFVIPLLNNLLLKVQFDDYFFAILTSVLWGSSDFSEFPFFTWAFYPIAGNIFAYLLIRTTNKNSIYGLLFVTSLIGLVITTYIFGNIFQLDLGMETELSYYHHTVSANIVYTFFVLAWISFLFYITKLLPKFIKSTLTRWSRNVTEIYVFHWIVIGWTAKLFYSNPLELPGFIVASIVVFIIADFSAVVFNNHKNFLREKVHNFILRK